MISFLVMLLIYMIPHSIQFSASLTYTVCYGFIALVLILYVNGLFRKTPPDEKTPTDLK